MKQVFILSIFPDIFSSFLKEGLLGKAIRNGLLNVQTVDLREFGIGKHRKVDDTPYGGGAGMVIRPEPIQAGIQHCEELAEKRNLHKILISPQGRTFKQKTAVELSLEEKPLLFICGRFEGFDERIRSLVDDEISLGDFITLGGETPTMLILESISRLIPGIIGNYSSLENESFSNHLLEYAQYTKPAEFNGMTVPDVLLSGNHQKIEEWRLNSAIDKTKKRRKDLYKDYKKHE